MSRVPGVRLLAEVVPVFLFHVDAVVVRRLLLRAALFLVPGTALWALLPLIASERLGQGAGGYGLLLGALGTRLALLFADTLPLKQEHVGVLLVPAALATALTGSLILTTRRRAVIAWLAFVKHWYDINFQPGSREPDVDAVGAGDDLILVHGRIRLELDASARILFDLLHPRLVHVQPDVGRRRHERVELQREPYPPGA